MLISFLSVNSFSQQEIIQSYVVKSFEYETVHIIELSLSENLTEFNGIWFALNLAEADDLYSINIYAIQTRKLKILDLDICYVQSEVVRNVKKREYLNFLLIPSGYSNTIFSFYHRGTNEIEIVMKVKIF